jgi:hypothetical protein
MDVGTGVTVWYFVVFLLVFGTVLTVWYFVDFHGCWNCPDGVVFCYFSIRTVLTVWYYVIFLLDFGTVLTVVFCCFSWMLELA